MKSASLASYQYYLCLSIVVFTVVSLTACNTYNSVVLDNKEHGLPCDKLPESQEADRVINEHQDLVQKILDINPGKIFFEIDQDSCPGHADIIISYPSSNDRSAIEKLINGDTFFGVPYRLRNQ